jgi:hypothetical protein
MTNRVPSCCSLSCREVGNCSSAEPIHVAVARALRAVTASSSNVSATLARWSTAHAHRQSIGVRTRRTDNRGNVASRSTGTGIAGDLIDAERALDGRRTSLDALPCCSSSGRNTVLSRSSRCNVGAVNTSASDHTAPQKKNPFSLLWAVKKPSMHSSPARSLSAAEVKGPGFCAPSIRGKTGSSELSNVETNSWTSARACADEGIKLVGAVVQRGAKESQSEKMKIRSVS